MDENARKFGDYRLLDRCGEGGFGEVWRAVGLDERVVALKIIGTRFRGDSWKSELKGLRAYQQKIPACPNLVQIYHVGETADCFYYTMELADNQNGDHYVPCSLAEFLKQKGRLTPDKVRDLIDQLLNGVECLHRAGLVHRDIKPANILWIKGVPKLADIGLVRDPKQTVSHGGTLAFFSPESNSPGLPADDFYALSMVAYCALTGLEPESYPEIPADLPLQKYESLRNVFINGCSSDPKKRFKSVQAFREAKYLNV